MCIYFPNKFIIINFFLEGSFVRNWLKILICENLKIKILFVGEREAGIGGGGILQYFLFVNYVTFYEIKI